MKIENCNVTFIPTKNHFSEIEEWLEKEYQEYDEGFYCNWNIISNSFDQKRLAVLIQNDKAIGFLVFRTSELIVNIEIAEIKPDLRKKGLGKLLIESCLNRFLSNGILVAELYCSPLSSEPIWKKMEFINSPILPNDNSKVRLYRPLIATNENQTVGDFDEVIELWNKEPSQINNNSPFRIWNIEYKKDSNEISDPVIYPAHYDWQICWRKGNDIKKMDKVKYFDLVKIEYGNFIIIRNLPKT